VAARTGFDLEMPPGGALLPPSSRGRDAAGQRRKQRVLLQRSKIEDKDEFEDDYREAPWEIARVRHKL